MFPCEIWITSKSRVDGHTALACDEVLRSAVSMSAACGDVIVEIFQNI